MIFFQTRKHPCTCYLHHTLNKGRHFELSSIQFEENQKCRVMNGISSLIIYQWYVCIQSASVITRFDSNLPSTAACRFWVVYVEQLVKSGCNELSVEQARCILPIIVR